MLVEQKHHIASLINKAIAPLLAGADPSVSSKAEVVLERPRDPAHGDIACNIAMQIAKPLKKIHVNSRS